MAGPQKLDVYLEGLAAFQEGATLLRAGEGLCLQQQEGGRLACVTQGGAAVGLVPADKRAMLSRGPWSGTVRTMKRQAPTSMTAAPPTSAAAGGSDALAAAGTGMQPVSATAAIVAGHEAAEAGAAAAVEEQLADASPQGQPGLQETAVAPVVQLLVRFTPEEQRWQQRQQPPEGQQQPPEVEDTARLSAEQLELLANSEEVRWMLRDERLQKVVADVDGAADRERALLRALQAPNFKEFADKVLSTVAPDPS